MIRPDTTMGRALANRSLELSRRQPAPADAASGALDLATPAPQSPAIHIREAAKAALDRGETHYTVRPGVPELRAAIARRSTADGFTATTESTVVTNGGAEALYIALQSTLKRGDTLLAATPLAPNVVEMVEFIGAHVRRLPLDRERFTASVADVERADGAVLLLGSPSPITGIAIPPTTLAALVSTALERDMAVIVDRTLAWCCYEPSQMTFPDPGLAARVLTTGSFSAAYAMSGWRVGYFTAPVGNLADMRELKQAMSICTSAVSQFAALAAIEGSSKPVLEQSVALEARRDALTQAAQRRGLSVMWTDAWPPLLLDRRVVDGTQFVAEPGSRYAPELAEYVRIDLRVPATTFDALLEHLNSEPTA